MVHALLRARAPALDAQVQGGGVPYLPFRAGPEEPAGCAESGRRWGEEERGEARRYMVAEGARRRGRRRGRECINDSGEWWRIGRGMEGEGEWRGSGVCSKGKECVHGVMAFYGVINIAFIGGDGAEDLCGRGRADDATCS